MVRFVALVVGFLALLSTPASADEVAPDPFESSALLAAPQVPDEFVEETAFDNLLAPASIAFAPDGRVFVAQLDGVIKVFDGLEDTTATVYADLSEEVDFHNDRGLLGMTLDPQFSAGRPYVYVLYTYDGAIGETAPRWDDHCPDPPGAERDGCVVSGRLSKLLPDGTEVPLISDEWCQQYPSHSVGDLHFGPDGALYASGGDGASYTFADYGQDGSPVNPCGDPPQPVGGTQTPPTAEGGALRSQDARTSGDPTGLNGSLIRIDPDTGDPLPTNPGTGDINARRIVAYGFRNPFRFAFRPGTTDAYVGDVGWLAWEEINRVPDMTQVRNYGWPCYEGGGRQPGYEAIGLDICENLYDDNVARDPLYTYNHGAKVADEACRVGGSSISGMQFYTGGTFPAAYQGALFFADYSRGCIWVMFPGPDGIPNPATRQVFVDGAQTPVDLEIGPDGDLYYADVGGGTIRRVRAVNPNLAPTAAFTATPDAGDPPLAVEFDATGSTDPNEDTLQYAWDLDGDGQYDDATGATPSRTYTLEGSVTVRLRVTDPGGLSATKQTEITVGTPPAPTITSPAAGTKYAVGDLVSFAGTATSGGSEMPADELTWTVDLHHCSAIVPTSCHVHHIQDFAGVRSGSFSYPDHEYPSYITLELTATKPSGLQAGTSVRIDPKTVALHFESEPSGLRLAIGGEASTTPFTRSVAQNSTVGVAAPPSQFLGVDSYDFSSWSDGGSATHQFTAPSTDTTYTATYEKSVCPVLPGLVGAWGFDEPSGDAVGDASGTGNAGTISGAVRVAGGRYGRALSFDGSNDLVTIADDTSLDFVSGMTLEAWVNPTAIGSLWRTVMLKEQPGNLAYALYANDGEGNPTGHIAAPLDSRVTGPPVPVNTWTHLATTYDGATLTLYVNGSEVADLPVFGAITVSNGALRIGGNTVWSEWFAGRIDEVRAYDRALSAAEIGADMARAVTCGGVPGSPALAVAPASLAFSSAQGDPSPAAKTLDVSNAGAGTLDWTAADDVPWLSVSPTGGSGDGTLTVTPDTAGLAAGTYTATVTISAAGAAGSPRTVPVTLTVDPPPPGPALSVTPASLSFTATEGGTDPADRTLTVSNGGGTLEWAASDDAAWLSVTPGSGTGAGAVTVSAAVEGLAAGSHQATITIAADGATGSPRTIPVTLTVDPPPEPPQLAVAPTTLSFTATEGAATVETKAFNVTNAGDGTLDFSASADVAWLTVTPAAGSAPRTVSITPSTAGLAPGEHTGTVTVSADGAAGAPKTVDVTFTVTEAPACPVPTGLVGAWGFDEPAGDTAVDASPAGNSGTISGAARTADGRFGGALSFDGVNDWVTVDDASSLRLTTGMTASAWVNPSAGRVWRTVLLKQRAGGMSYALYGNTDSGQPSGHVSTPLETSTKAPSALPIGVWTHLATTYDGTTLRLFVNGVQVSSRAVSGAISNDAGALRIGGNSVWNEPFAGRIDEVRLYDRALTAAEIQGDMAAPVTCSAPAEPVLSVTPASLSFSVTAGNADPAGKTLTIANAGGGTLDWTASADAAWLDVAPASGTGGRALTVSAATDGLAAGTYDATITVAAAGADGSPATIPVTLTVAPTPPVLSVTPASLSFSATAGEADPAAKTLDVANAGPGSLDWTASESAPWLSVAPAGGTGGGSITVTPSIAGLDAGTYTTDVTVSAAGATGSPTTVPVTLTVDPPPPALALAPANLSFTATDGGADPVPKDVTVTNAGGGSLSFTVGDDAPWLAVTPADGSAPATLSVAPSVAGLAVGTYTATVTVTADGVAGSPKTVDVTLEVSEPPATPPGLIAAYGFEEPSGTTVTDASGNGHGGTISGATRSESGRFGAALTFDGVNDWVTVPDTDALDLTTGVTMSAWVNPTAVGSAFRTVLMKERPGGLIYTLYAGDGAGRPSGHVFTTSEQRAAGTANTPLNTWTHLAMTWDGATLRLYVDGTQVSSRAVSGTLLTSTGALRIGGNGVWTEWFAGRIDEVRLYGRALTAAEIQADMERAVTGSG
ncbi:MAG TPA: LamG-like jellyroll fold domain-containing protein [Solirubrobacteraceae bacterium]|nr:LamG-like jellyroll fold domain-containing protein [Solirubrobacteraceae bacterium]